MKMKSKNWSDCGFGDGKGFKRVTVGFFKETDEITFSPDQWETFKKEIEDCFESID